MNEIFSNIKKYLLVILLPTALLVILSISCLKDIEQNYIRFKYGRDITLYLRKSTDLLTYLGAAYTTTSDKKFLDQFNNHLKEREKYFNEEVFTSKILTQEETREFRKGLDISNDLAKDIENPAFAAMDNKAIFSDKYLSYKEKIYENINSFRALINDSSEAMIKEETQLLNIYLYSLCLIIVLLVFIIKNGDHPIKKKSIKRKKR